MEKFEKGESADKATFENNKQMFSMRLKDKIKYMRVVKEIIEKNGICRRRADLGPTIAARVGLSNRLATSGGNGDRDSSSCESPVLLIANTKRTLWCGQAQGHPTSAQALSQRIRFSQVVICQDRRPIYVFPGPLASPVTSQSMLLPE